jgi:hypothetical protein
MRRGLPSRSIVQAWKFPRGVEVPIGSEVWRLAFKTRKPCLLEAAKVSEEAVLNERKMEVLVIGAGLGKRRVLRESSEFWRSLRPPSIALTEESLSKPSL